MNTALLQQMGLGGVDAGYLVIGMGVLVVLVLILLVILIVQGKKINALKGRLDRFTTGKDGESLEDEIAALFEDNSFLKSQAEKSRKDIRTLFRRMHSVYQKMGLVKYDAFNQMGGKLSFCLAMLDEDNNGFILNSVHSSDGCYSYTKEIKGGASALALGQEEEEALQKALEEKPVKGGKAHRDEMDDEDDKGQDAENRNRRGGNKGKIDSGRRNKEGRDKKITSKRERIRKNEGIDDESMEDNEEYTDGEYEVEYIEYIDDEN